MSKLTQAARGKDCSVRIIGYCNGNAETVVSAHINGTRFGHGTGQKVSDLLAADCCSSCHDVLDYRVRSNYTKEELKLFHYEGVMETLLRRQREGLINAK
jgi:hypothetical protein